MVALWKRAQLAGGGEIPHRRYGLPGVRETGDRAGGKRPGNDTPGTGGAVGHRKERTVDAGAGGGGQQPEGVVALRGRPRVESGSQLTHRPERVRLSRLRREGKAALRSLR